MNKYKCAMLTVAFAFKRTQKQCISDSKYRRQLKPINWANYSYLNKNKYLLKMSETK